MSQVIWEGPSAFDGTPIFGALTHTGDNSALCTGRQTAVQLWVLPAEHPQEALVTGRDAAVCGECPLRPWRGETKQTRTCYVGMMVVNQVWKSAAPTHDLKEVLRRMAGADILRLGAYGDPAVMPYETIEEIADVAKRVGIKRRVGYTKRWRDCDPRFRHLLMASTIGPRQTAEAIAAGWRPFAIRRIGDPVTPGTRQCPKAGDGLQVTCASCGQCDGFRGEHDRRLGYSLEIHGSGLKSRVAQFNRVWAEAEGLPEEGADVG